VGAVPGGRINRPGIAILRGWFGRWLVGIDRRRGYGGVVINRSLTALLRTGWCGDKQQRADHA